MKILFLQSMDSSKPGNTLNSCNISDRRMDLTFTEICERARRCLSDARPNQILHQTPDSLVVLAGTGGGAGELTVGLKKREETILRQCDFCAFKLTEDQATEVSASLIESKYRAVRQTRNAPKKSRNIHVGGEDDRTETCFIDAPAWNRRKENIYCPDRIDNSLSLETALDLREARKANEFARDANRVALSAKIWAIIATILAAIAIAAPYVISPLK